MILRIEGWDVLDESSSWCAKTRIIRAKWMLYYYGKKINEQPLVESKIFHNILSFYNNNCNDEEIMLLSTTMSSRALNLVKNYLIKHTKLENIICMTILDIKKHEKEKYLKENILSKF